MWTCIFGASSCHLVNCKHKQQLYKTTWHPLLHHQLQHHQLAISINASYALPSLPHLHYHRPLFLSTSLSSNPCSSCSNILLLSSLDSPTFAGQHYRHMTSRYQSACASSLSSTMYNLGPCSGLCPKGYSRYQFIGPLFPAFCIFHPQIPHSFVLVLLPFGSLSCSTLALRHRTFLPSFQPCACYCALETIHSLLSIWTLDICIWCCVICRQ